MPPRASRREGVRYLRDFELLGVDGLPRGRGLGADEPALAVLLAHQQPGHLGPVGAIEADLRRRIQAVARGLTAGGRDEGFPLEPAQRVEQVVHLRAVRGALTAFQDLPLRVAPALEPDALARGRDLHALAVS